METETYKKAKEILEKFDPNRFKQLEVCIVLTLYNVQCRRKELYLSKRNLDLQDIALVQGHSILLNQRLFGSGFKKFSKQ